MSLPGYLHDEANGHAGFLVGTAEAINHKEALVGELLLGQLLDSGPSLLRSGLVVVLIFVARPPHRVLGVFVHDDELVLGRTASVDTGHHVYGTEFRFLTYLEAFETCLGLFFKELLVGGVVYDLGNASDTVLA